MPTSPRHWLFAYGSLINADSRALSFSSNHAQPARVRGFRRGWFHTAHDQPLSGVVATHGSAAHVINGVLIQLDEDQLQHADARELPFGYVRTLVDRSVIDTVSDELTARDQAWIYAVPDVADDRTSVIYQSYLDVILAGCLAIDDGFAREFVRSTGLWHAPWIDDRPRPRYLRAMPPGPMHERIDALLRETLPAAFAARGVLD